MGENAPQNHSCRVVVPPQTRFFSEIGRKHEMQMKWKMREIYIFYFSYELGARTRANGAEGGRTRGNSSAAQLGALRRGPVHWLL